MIDLPGNQKIADQTERAAGESTSHEQAVATLRDLSTAVNRFSWLLEKKGPHYAKTQSAWEELAMAQTTAFEFLAQHEG